MYTRILVAVDGSETSKHALQHAIVLARRLSASLRIIHVVDMNWLPLGPELSIDTQTIARARRSSGEKVIEDASELASKAEFEAEAELMETETPTQHVAEVIAKEALNWPADVVVLGTHGRRGVQRLLLGSVAEQMARRSPVPVLLIPSP